MMPVEANAPVNDRVEPTTIGLLLVGLFVVAFLVLHAAVPLATSSSAATTDRMRLGIMVSFRIQDAGGVRDGSPQHGQHRAGRARLAVGYLSAVEGRAG